MATTHTLVPHAPGPAPAGPARVDELSFEHLPDQVSADEPHPDAADDTDTDWHARAERRRRRVSRALVSASVGTAIAAASHLAGGGPLPGALGVAAAWTVTAWLGVFLPGRPEGLLRLVATISGSQFFFHALFLLGVHTPGCSVPGGPHAGHHGAVDLPAGCAMPVHLGHSEPRMMLWHVVAAAASIVALRRVDRTAALLRGFAELLAARVTARLLLLLLHRPLIASPRPSRPVVAWSRCPVPAGVFPESFRRRGPPLTLAA